MRRILPWGNGSGRPWPSPLHVLRAPFIAIFLAISWALFLAMAQPEDGWQVPRAELEPYAYAIPELSANPPQAFMSLVTAPWVNGDSIQIVYVSVLLVLFAWPFEAKEGTLRTALLFAATMGLASIIAGLLLHALVGLLDVRIFENAWDRIWTGGSAGAFGLMGALAARAPVPWPLLAFFVFWEINVGGFFLRSYTPAFHLTALALGFVATRYWLHPRRGSTLADSTA